MAKKPKKEGKKIEPLQLKTPVPEKCVWYRRLDQTFLVEVHRFLNVPPEARGRTKELSPSLGAVSEKTGKLAERLQVVSSPKHYSKVNPFHYCGKLYIFGCVAPHGLLHEHPVFLSYQAAYGPDKDDVALWEELAIALVDKKMDEFYKRHPDLSNATVHSIAKELKERWTELAKHSEQELKEAYKSNMEVFHVITKH